MYLILDVANCIAFKGNLQLFEPDGRESSGSSLEYESHCMETMWQPLM